MVREVCRQLLPARDTLLAELHHGGKVLSVPTGLDVSALLHRRASQTGEHSLGQAGTRIGHGQGRAALAVLGRDNYSASILHFLVEVGNLVLRDALRRGALREERQDGGAGMAAYDRDPDLIYGLAGQLVHELFSTDAVERRHTNDLLGIQTLLGPELAHRRNNGVYRIHNEGHHGLGAILRTSLHDVKGDLAVDVEQVLAILARLAGQAGGHHHEAASL
mmetsp:Transcript_15232/g.31973  ORF Transcript_15232/g.31973 Transcript_15232/m.31973 type:complete len:220 (+) Transcript_15232:194-853(+)